jgi:hypothetical protein
MARTGRSREREYRTPGMHDVMHNSSLYPDSARQIGAVRLTVWRRFEKLGRGHPVVLIGDEGPGDGWMLCRSARINLCNASADAILVELASAFACFGLQYANKVSHLTEVLEEFAAVCLALGIELPISDDGWAIYELSELQPATPEEHRRLLAEIKRVFGARCATNQAVAWHIDPSDFDPASEGNPTESSDEIRQ